VDFGEARDLKYFVIVEVDTGQAKVSWHELKGIRSFVDLSISLENADKITKQLEEALSPKTQLENAIVRLIVDYPREWEAMIDDAAIREFAAGAFEFHLVKRPQFETRVRLPEGQLAGSMSPMELLDLYWGVHHVDSKEAELLNEMAKKIIIDQEDQQD
jgi:exonuclease SbcD